MTEQYSNFIEQHGFATFVAVALGAAFWIAAQTVGEVFLEKIESYQIAQVELTTKAIESNHRMSEALREFQHQQTMRNAKVDELSAGRERLQAEMLKVISSLRDRAELEMAREKSTAIHLMHALNISWEAQGLPKPFPDSVINESTSELHHHLDIEAGNDK